MASPAGRRVSFVVLSHNSTRVLERCVRSLVAQAAEPGQDDIWIVENGSIDGSADVVRRLQTEFEGVVTGIFLDRNHGTTYSRNLALRQVRSDYVAVVDSDVCVPDGAVDGLIRVLETHPRAGLVAPALVYRDGRLQLSADRFPTLWHKARRWLSLRSMEQHLNDLPRMSGVREVDYVISAFWLLRGSAVRTVGLLDERIFYAPEDVDYCIRMWQAGCSVLYDPSIEVVHDAQEISRGTLKPIAWSHLAGLLYLFRKHRYLTRASLRRRMQRGAAVASVA